MPTVERSRLHVEDIVELIFIFQKFRKRTRRRSRLFFLNVFFVFSFLFFFF